MPYPNVEPIRSILLELGFEEMPEYSSYYVRMMGEQPLYLYLWEQWVCWDGTDMTHLDYCFRAPPHTPNNPGVSWAHLPIKKDDGTWFFTGETNVPEVEWVKQAIIQVIAEKKAAAEIELRAVHEKYTALASMHW
jgi:hypothetical protein